MSTRLTVAADDTGEYRTIQEVVMAMHDFTQVPAVIFIKNGTCREKLLIPQQKTNIFLLGESPAGVVITYGSYSSDAAQHMTYTSATVRAQGNDFTAENLTFENSAGPVDQAVFLHVQGDRTIFLHCRQYYQDCYIKGTTDFIFGVSTAVFEGCTIHSKPTHTSQPPRPSPHPQRRMRWARQLIRQYTLKNIFAGSVG